MSEFASEGSSAADEEVEHVKSQPDVDPLTQPGSAAESGAGEDQPADEETGDD